MLPPAIECQSRIREAPTDAEVVDLVRTFVREIDPALLEELPTDCRPGAIADRDEIMALNVQLARAELLHAESQPYAGILRSILGVTTQASVRFTQLSADGLLGPRTEG
jgi:hypothetical protein